MDNLESRTLRTTQTFHTPLQQMWEVWSNPMHIAQWWGPNGFTNTIHQMDFRQEGEWNFTMHGPDGNNYPNRSVFKEIIPYNKIVFEHHHPYFLTTVLFESEEIKTRIDWSMLFDTVEMYEIIIKAHHADDGQKQNLIKLEKYLSNII